MASPVGAEPEVVTGPGVLYIAPYGTALPDDFDDTLNAAFVEIGFTTSGHEFTFSTEKQEIKVAERLRPIRYQAGSTSATWVFTMAQYSPENIALAVPGTTVESTGGGSVKVVLPKVAGDSRYTLIHVSENGKIVHVLVKCYLSMSGASTFGSVDSADLAGIQVEAAIEENSAGDDAFVLFDEAVYAVSS